MRFAGQRRQEVYDWVERTLVRQEYAGLRRPDKGVLRLYLAQMTGLSQAQVTRLITGYQDTDRVIAAPYQDPLPHPLHGRRRGICWPTSTGRTGIWADQPPGGSWSGSTASWPGSLPEAGGDLGGPVVPAAQMPCSNVGQLTARILVQ